MNTTRPAMLGNINMLVKKPSQAKYRPIFTPKYFLIASSGWYLYHWPKEPQTLESLLRPESSESFFFKCRNVYLRVWTRRWRLFLFLNLEFFEIFLLLLMFFFTVSVHISTLKWINHWIIQCQLSVCYKLVTEKMFVILFIPFVYLF